MSTREPSAKRQRTNDTPTNAAVFPALASTPERMAAIQDKIRSMKPETVQERAALFVSLDTSGQFSLWMEQHHAADRAAERAQTTSFAKYARQADYVLNDKYERLSGSKQYEAAGDAEAEVERMLNDIVARTKEYSSYGTKRSAVETMGLIFEALLGADGVIGKEVRNACYGWDARFLKVMGTFTEEELEELANEDDGAWVTSFREIVSNASSYGVLKRLQESLEDLEAYQEGGEDDQDEDDGHDQNEEDENEAQA